MVRSLLRFLSGVRFHEAECSVFSWIGYVTWFGVFMYWVDYDGNRLGAM